MFLLKVYKYWEMEPEALYVKMFVEEMLFFCKLKEQWNYDGGKAFI